LDLHGRLDRLGCFGERGDDPVAHRLDENPAPFLNLRLEEGLVELGQAVGGAVSAADRVRGEPADVAEHHGDLLVGLDLSSDLLAVL
jgi:hypothetical protein